MVSGLLAVVAVGVVIGAQIVMLSLATGAVLFAGPLSEGAALGTAATLAGGMIATLVIGLMGAVPSAVAEVQEHGLAALATTLAAAVAPLALIDARISTAFAIIAATTLLTAALLFAIERLRLGAIVRYFPYPVLAGFLAGSGWLLTTAALGTVLGTSSDLSAWRALADPGALARIAPMLALALGMLIAARLSTQPLVPLGVLVAALLAYAGARSAGIVEATAAAAPAQAATFALPVPGTVAWDRVLAALPSIAAVAALSVAGALLNIGALATAVRARIDTNRELRITGLANVGMATVGAGPGFVSLGLTLTAHGLRVRSRLVCLVAAAVTGAALLLAGPIVAWVPPFVTGGLIAFLGLGFLLDWGWATRRQMPLGDWAIVLAVLAVTAVAGFLPAIGLGLGLAVALFVVDTMRGSVIRFDHPLSEMPSPRERGVAERTLLDVEGRGTQILALEGNLFFATGEAALRRLHEILRGGARGLVLDLSRVHLIDVTVATSLAEFAAAARDAGLDLSLVAGPENVERALERSGLPVDWPVRMPNLDRALEAAEESVLRGVVDEKASIDPYAILRKAVRGDDALMAAVLSEFTRIELAEGALVYAAGDPSDCIFLLVDGRVWIDDPTRVGFPLRPMRAGTVVGDVALLLGEPRAADLRALTPTTLLRLDAEVLARWERDAPDHALAVHRLIELTLIEKLLATNRAVALARR
ncbi:sulfate permease, SulP family [Jannaschia seohaensis]|uniref:SulP family sulfate permease n=2 Tax=Jannaschia seohaensis TaxID=475081 RepID=A0A2Y9C3K3_9RHOB|nr:SulP family sulfate permease [Jannaschia seohaensis]SSA51632.1 sulfate permease, SulP family [Jannaschia seohaensis]